MYIIKNNPEMIIGVNFLENTNNIALFVQIIVGIKIWESFFYRLNYQV